MGRVTDFAKRRIVGYILFWFLVIVILSVFYGGNQPVQAAWLFVLALAFFGSLGYTRRMKRKQREKRESAEQTVR